MLLILIFLYQDMPHKKTPNETYRWSCFKHFNESAKVCDLIAFLEEPCLT